ncbi:MAG: type VI secretion system baseplate subunit TssF, partial [Desulfovibrionaceae bacterium]|nr:type VI secretion system baseplate subunit TssF [Desulfovibrionaceae bacterium]
NETGAPKELVAANRRRCHAIRAFTSRQEERLFGGRLLRGWGLDLELEPSGFVSEGDMYLFADALDRFLAEFAGINTYSRLTLHVAGAGAGSQWPPRLGEKRLI